MKQQVVLFEHEGCTRSHFSPGDIRRCPHRESRKWVSEYEYDGGTYFLLTPEEVETIQALREGTAKCIPVNTVTTEEPPRSTSTETSPGT